ncbi:MAG: RsbRD N-terminal domain-containing protein [Thermodesulfovibrionales bacterium]|nr:RsbRD N-terminal domain-containing protein [Thermodesulfovibrionales bacterium]
MNLKDLLLEKKSSILKRWFEAIVASYPPDASNFFKNNHNQFANPVGYTFSEVARGLFEELLQGGDPERYFPYLNDIIKIKAVQDFSPSQSVSFFFLLKKVVREELRKELQRNQFQDELHSLDSEIDALALLAFDVYMKCRERIFELRTNEIKRMMFRLLKKADLIREIEDGNQGLGEETVLTQKIEG